jgi:hypothetical protein
MHRACGFWQQTGPSDPARVDRSCAFSRSIAAFTSAICHVGGASGAHDAGTRHGADPAQEGRARIVGRSLQRLLQAAGDLVALDLAHPGERNAHVAAHQRVEAAEEGDSVRPATRARHTATCTEPAPAAARPLIVW